MNSNYKENILKSYRNSVSITSSLSYHCKKLSNMFYTTFEIVVVNRNKRPIQYENTTLWKVNQYSGNMVIVHFIMIDLHSITHMGKTQTYFNLK